ncbi:MAG TPA: T9SS type A sorting domain-containing protein [Bacteroidetes bacterium]|nr:T9SS type A sorting domain-containing protein [Bacteroidota bacterium]
MKKPLFLIALCFSISLFSFAQYSIVDYYANLTFSLTDTADCSEYIDLKLYVKNNSGSTLDSMRARFISLTMPDSIIWNYGDNNPPIPGNDDWSVQLCEGVGSSGNCFDITLLGSSFDIPLGNMAPGESNELKVSFVPYGIPGCGVLKIYVYHQADSTNGDTLSFSYCCLDMSSVKEIPASGFEVYPNITSDKVNIKLNRTLNNGQIIITNLLGQTVNKLSTDGHENISLSTHSMQEGCYFILLTENGKAIENKRLYIKK